MRVRDGGAWRDINAGNVYVGGAWKQIVEVRAYEADAWRTVATFVAPMSLDISPDSAFATRFGAGVAVSRTVTATPTGGQGPYTYSWTNITTGGTATATNPNSATTSFSRFLENEEEVSETFLCVVTDSFGTTAQDQIVTTFFSIDLNQ